MRIALTADNHLADKNKYPERYAALEDILRRVKAGKVRDLFVAGDLFDKEFRNYKDFEALCKKYPEIQLHIIPGNHDININEKSIVSPNVHIYTEPAILELDSALIVLIPYSEKSKMGDKIAALEGEIKGKEWILVSHGDYCSGTREVNPLEPGVYMPLSRENINSFNPRAVFLGHIHKPIDYDGVCYIGSPCGLDISEVGERRFLLYNTDDGGIAQLKVNTDILYFEESFIIIPVENEIELLRNDIKNRIQSWGIHSEDHHKITVRVSAVGYAMDRSKILKTLEKGFAGYNYYKGEPPSIENLSSSTDPQLNAIAKRAIEFVDGLEWEFGGDQPDKEQIKLEALKVIYQE